MSLSEPVLTPDQVDAVIAQIRARLGEYFRQHGLKYAVFGKSEGLDSSVIAGLLSEIPGVQPIGVVMPIQSKPFVREIGHEVLTHFGIPALEIDLEPQFQSVQRAFAEEGLETELEQLLEKLDDTGALTRLQANRPRAYGNIKARLRMITLYHLAQLLGGVVISTDNYSEYWMGFWTLNGDVGDIAPIQQVFKGRELYTIAERLGVPASSLQAVPSDGLGITPNSHDEEQLGLPYDQLDEVVMRILQRGYSDDPDGDPVGARPSSAAGKRTVPLQDIANELGLPLSNVQSIHDRMRSTRFKRHWPVIFSREDVGLPPV